MDLPRVVPARGPVTSGCADRGTDSLHRPPQPAPPSTESHPWPYRPHTAMCASVSLFPSGADGQAERPLAATASGRYSHLIRPAQHEARIERAYGFSNGVCGSGEGAEKLLPRVVAGGIRLPPVGRLREQWHVQLRQRHLRRAARRAGKRGQGWRGSAVADGGSTARDAFLGRERRAQRHRSGAARGGSSIRMSAPACAPANWGQQRRRTGRCGPRLPAQPAPAVLGRNRQRAPSGAPQHRST